ncbi:MAG: hypothetical protein E7310_08840 [Clostridiales bacterium]|nr:hypothetical protein [Clostridiales bacterium]
MLSFTCIRSRERINLFKEFDEEERENLKKFNVILEDREYNHTEYSSLSEKLTDYFEEYDKVEKLGISYKKYDELTQNFSELQIKYKINFVEDTSNERLRLYKLLSKEDIVKLQKLHIFIVDKGYVWSELEVLESVLKEQIEKLSEIEITQEEFEIFIKNFRNIKELYYGEEAGFRLTNKSYNIFKLMSDKDKEIIQKLGISLEDRAYTPKEFIFDITSKISDYNYSIFGTNISKIEALLLYERFCNIIYENINYCYEW